MIEGSDESSRPRAALSNECCFGRTSLSDAQDSKERIAEAIVSRTLGVNSMRALGIRSSYKGRTVDA